MNKRLTKAYEFLGEEKVHELGNASVESLEKQVVTSSEAMQKAQSELEAMPKYQAAKQVLKDLSVGKKEVDKRQKALILVALSLLNPE